MIQRIPPPSSQHHFCFRAFPTRPRSPLPPSPPRLLAPALSLWLLCALAPSSRRLPFPSRCARRPALRCALCACALQPREPGPGVAGASALRSRRAGPRLPGGYRVGPGAVAALALRAALLPAAAAPRWAAPAAPSARPPTAADAAAVSRDSGRLAPPGSERCDWCPPARQGAGSSPRMGVEPSLSVRRCWPGGGGPRAPRAPRRARPGSGAGVTPSPECSRALYP